MKKVTAKSETPIKKKMKFSVIIQTIGLLAIIYALINSFAGWTPILPAWLGGVGGYVLGMLMGTELSKVKEVDTDHSSN